MSATKSYWCRCSYDACPHSLRLKQEAKICLRVRLTEMRACFSYIVLVGSIVVEEVGVVLVHITESRLAGWVPGARQCSVYFCISR